jgi:hypothetical protein
MIDYVAQHDLGEFQLTQPVARVSDPCYDKKTWCAGTIDNCKTGTWKAKVVMYDESDWGTRVGNLIAYHSDINAPSLTNSDWKLQEIDVGVDAGMCGIFDDKYFKDDDSIEGVKRLGGKGNSVICEDEPWYSICCDRSMSEHSGGVIPYGCNSSSGYGDGSYKAFSLSKDGKVVAIMIDFGLSQEDEEEEMVECSNCDQQFEVDDLDDDGFCSMCHEKLYVTCSECDSEFDADDIVDGACLECREEMADKDLK